MDIQLLIIAIGLFEILLGFYVFSRNARSITHRVFLFLSLSVGFWTIGTGSIFLYHKVMSASVLRIIANLVLWFGLATSFALYLFGYVFPERTKSIKRSQYYWLFITLTLYIGFLFFTDLIIKDVYPNLGLKEVIKINSGYIVVSLFFITNIIITGYFFCKKFISSSGIIRQQLIYVGLGLISALITAAITHNILPMFNNYSLIWMGPIYPSIIIIAISYTIIRYRLMDIQLFIKRTTIYLALISTIFGVYVYGMIGLEYFLNRTKNPNENLLLTIIVSAILAFTLPSLRDWLDIVTNKIFYQKKYDYYKVLDKISRELNAVVRFQDIINIVFKSLDEVMHLKFVGFYLNEKPGSPFVCQKTAGNAEHLPESIEVENPLVEYLQNNKNVLETGEFRHVYEHLYQVGKILDRQKANIQNELDNTFKSALVLPLILKNFLIGFLVLGEKLSGDQFTNRDLNMLETMASQMSMTLENIRLFDQMMSSERLAIIGTMAAGIAHEIRNPLASIKTFIQMLPDKHAKPDFMKSFNEIVPSEIERLNTITADLLTFSRPSAPRFENMAIKLMIERIHTLLNHQMRKRQIEFEANFEDLPDVQVDAQQIQQVFINIVLNAIHASSPNKKITVSAQVLEEKNDEHKLELFMHVSIRDQGHGIKKSDMENLFQPFFTTKTEGTGLGLATSKRIVEAHRGKILVESEEGKGSVFTVVIPIKAKISQEVEDQQAPLG